MSKFAMSFRNAVTKEVELHFFDVKTCVFNGKSGLMFIDEDVLLRPFIVTGPRLPKSDVTLQKFSADRLFDIVCEAWCYYDSRYQVFHC